MKKVAEVCLGVIFLIMVITSPGSSSTLPFMEGFQVDAKLHSFFEPLNTGIMINFDDCLTIWADQEDTWNLLVNDENPDGHPDYESNADGLETEVTNDDITFRSGLLMGKINDGEFFKIGTFFQKPSTESGILYLFNWDKEDRYFNNTGLILAHVEVNNCPPAVPEPSTLILFGTGLAGLAGIRRRLK